MLRLLDCLTRKQIRQQTDTPNLPTNITPTKIA